MGNNEYVPISSEVLEERMNDILDCWKVYFQKVLRQYNEVEPNLSIEYTVNSVALRELVERVYQRKDYFLRYHSDLKMSEFKEIGLNVFWISKFKPFQIKANHNIDKLAFETNDDFAMFHMFTALGELAKRLKLDINMEKIPRSLYCELAYCLNFRDISKEALGMIVELIARIAIPNLPE